MENPAERAEQMRSAYREYFIGRGGRAARSVANRLADGENDITGMRGPYLQALDIPNWSNQSWESFARSAHLEPHIRHAFSKIGFERLYDFQERSIESVLNGDDTVITAATGRGKTEAWLIPILNQILEAKRLSEDKKDDTSIKALLIYPTKALAQDQLKRLLHYLYLINKQLKSSQQISVGIYDGDTPRNMSDSGAEGYLNSTFKHFECPGYNSELDKCQDCGGGVRIRNNTNRFKLIPEKAYCEEDEPNDVPLDFLRLTKNDILDNGVDILLTNPDTINYRLININAHDEHERFIYEPEFLVFDEVHTYDGLFGSYTSSLMKRVQALREEKDVDDLQLIASSATVENDVELFQKVSGAVDVTQVTESPRDLDVTEPSTIPEEFKSDDISVEDILQATSSTEDSIPGLSDFDYALEEASNYDRDRRETIVADALFDYLTSDHDEPGVRMVQYVHQLLYDEPLTKPELHQKLSKRLDLDYTEVEPIVDNIRVLGEFSGILENRSHMFSWPIDGFYACAACDAVYRTPQDSCRECESNFVTRSTYCRHCSDEHLVAWYCPTCDQLDTYTPTEHGSVGQENDHICSRCQMSRDETVQMVRSTFKPFLRCLDCGYLQERTITSNCSDCGCRTVRTDSMTVTCINPRCGASQIAENECIDCGGSQFEVATVEGDIDCRECGESYSGDIPEYCSECNSLLVLSRYIPWVCTNDDCDIIHLEEDPEKCSCGTSSFVKRGLFEISRDRHCRSCNTSLLGEGECECETPDIREREGKHQAYKTVDTRGAIYSMSSHSSAVPCPHRYARYEIGSRFDELMRSPNNLAATTSQYLMRAVADDEGERAAKLLSFADSHRDMKELSRDFSEPEVETLLDQLLVRCTSKENDTSWVSSDDVLECAAETVEDLGEKLDPPQVARNVEFDLKSRLKNQPRKRWDEDDALQDRLKRRALSHTYNQRLGERDPSLSEIGLLDVRLSVGLESLSNREKSVIRELVDKGNDYHIAEFGEVNADKDINGVISDLVDRDILTYGNSEEYVSLDPSALEFTVAGDNDGIRFSPEDEKYYTTLHYQFGLSDSTSVLSNASLTERASISHPRFTQRAHRIEHSKTRILISEEYLGTTDKRKRRELEFLFREENYPHHLSSGPTMELGVDIGSLDALLLYGTPPNMNAYLQRVGRAGRSSHSSLVHSVSQRNPIDYYYYDHPEDLISADPTPVPLNEHNEEVLRVSLSWSIFDYIAANFCIPWEVSYHGRGRSVNDGDTYHKHSIIDESTRKEASKLTHLMSLSAENLSLSNTDHKLSVLSRVVSDNESEVAQYLRSLLEYQYCEDCERRYPADSEREFCERDDCEGRLCHAKEQFGHLVEEAISNFDERYITHYRNYRQSLEDERVSLTDKRRELQREQRKASRGERKDIMKERTGLKERIDVLKDHMSELDEMNYFDFLRESRESKYDFSMRSVASTAGLTLVDEGYDRRNVSEQSSGRSMRMALSELHPGAAYLDNGETYTVARVRFDEKESSDLRESVEEISDENLADELVCPACHTTYSLDTQDCDCENDVPLKRRRLAVLESAEAYHDNLKMTSDGEEARYLHDEPNQEVQNTYAERETSIISFEPDQKYELRTGGKVFGTLKYGDYSVLLHSNGYRTKYKSGEVDPQKSLFEVCGEENCPGIIYKDREDRRRCSADSEHFPEGRGADSELVRLGYKYETQGIRVELGNRELSHTMAHGLRVALQYLGGVSIRELSEYVGEQKVDVFESQEGGIEVSRLLFGRSDGEFRAFDRAMEILTEQVDCECENGCPSCLYQYGCDVRNAQRSFDLDKLQDILDTGRLSIESTGEQETDESIRD